MKFSNIIFGITLLVLASFGYSIPAMAQQTPSAIADWARLARIGGFDASPQMSDQEVSYLMEIREAEKVSVLEVDSGLSFYLNNEEFQEQVNFLDRVASMAHDRSMRAVAYYPSLEVNTKNGETIAETMYKEHPDWVQYGIDGTPNVFYGTQEVWVDPGMESAWMSPNTPYRDYFLNRIRQLAATNLDGVWVDVPIYLDTGTAWPGAEPAAALAFNAWSKAQGLGGSDGYQVPTEADFNNPEFMAWIRWRHENLADFTNDIRQAAQEVNPQFMVIIENYPTDYMDATQTGLDGTYRRSNTNFLRVWEIDSVSNTKAMQWSSKDDFSNKLTMYKWARAVDRENPSWAFSYGNQPLDAGLTMAAAVTTGVAPFESQTPEMTLSVDTLFRERWFSFIQAHEQALLDTSRAAKVGIWYSSATRDYQDYKAEGGYGMYVTEVPPTNDPDWWAFIPNVSAVLKPHLGGYRGAAHALINLHIPFKVITDPGNPTGELEDVEFLWLPSVAAISDAVADTIKNFVANGGVVFATGKVPGTMDEMGNLRAQSVFQDLFNLAPTGTPEQRTNVYGQGIAIYNPNVRGSDLFASVGDLIKANKGLSTVEQLVRIHVQDDLIVKAPEGVHVEIGKASDTQHYLYVINYSGLQLPLVSSPQNIGIDYRAPAGYRVASASVATPDTNGQSGSLSIQKTANQYYGFDVNIDQFALITLTLAPEAASTPASWPTPIWSSPARQEAAQSGMNFTLDSMRHSDKPEPYAFGVYTNLLNDVGLTDIYAHGHHVTAEHMGLMLRASACMGDTLAYQQSYRYIDEVMKDPVYNVVNWAIDRDRDQPLVEFFDQWTNANSPLDDTRVIRGLLAGPAAADLPEASELAEKLVTGLYWTSITDRDRKTTLEFPAYPDGIVGYAWDWNGTTDAALNPPAVATGIGQLSTDPIPTDYNNLFVLGQAAKFNPRWIPVLVSATDLLINAELTAVPGLFYNGYEANGNWTGDFENRFTNHGRHIKIIQSLWIALHLARASTLEPNLLDAERRAQAALAAERSLTFFKNYYLANNRIPEYLTVNGEDVPNCNGQNTPDGCLISNEENLINGEARIYALVARLALRLGDSSFASKLIEEKILTDRISDPNDPRYGLIGLSTAGASDAEAFNILESVLTLCLEARYNNPSSNQAPLAGEQSVTLLHDTSAPIMLNASDPNGDPLTYQITSQPAQGTLTGTAPNLVYAPKAGYAGSDSFTFKVNDGELDSNVATVSIIVIAELPANHAPIATAQSVTTAENSSVIILLTATDHDGDVLTYNVMTDPTQGILSGIAPNLLYTPNQGYTGVDGFTFLANDGELDSAIANIDITVQAASGNSEVSNPVSALTIDGNLSDWAGLRSFGTDPNDITGANNKLDWLEGWMAHDAVNFYVAYRNEGPVDNDNWWAWQLYIDTDNNPDTGYKFDAIGAEYHIEENVVSKYTGDGNSWSWQQQGIAASAISGNLVELRFARAWIGNAARFNLAFYGENVAFPGGDMEDHYPDGWVQEQATVRFFRYTTLAAPTNYAPVATPQSIVTAENSSVQILLTATDQDGDALTYRVLTQPTQGSLSGTPPNLVYTPNQGYTGTDGFTFSANDGQLESNSASIYISVQAANANGEISNPTAALTIDGNLSDWAGLQSFGSDPNDVTGANNKLDWLEGWMAHDDNNFYVAYHNDGPIDTNNWWGWQIYIDVDNNPTTGYLLDSIGADYHIEENVIRKYIGDGDNWNWLEQGVAASAVSGDKAELSFARAWIGNAASFNLVFYGENVAFAGGDMEDHYPDGLRQEQAPVRFFRYATQAVPTNGRAPVASDQAVTLLQGTSTSITLNASDADNDPLLYQITSQPAHGTLSGNAPNLVYAPNANYAGGDSFTFQANDGQLDSNIATVSITVNPVTSNNHAPIANAQNVVTGQNSPATILLTATDQDGDVLTYRVLTQPTHGTLSGNPPNLLYTPNQGYQGNDSFTFVANDGQLDSANANIEISVQATGGNGEISNPTSNLIVDGNLSDWAGLQSFGSDPDDVTGTNNKLDWQEGWMAHDANNIYVAYRNQGPVDINNWWAWQIYIDVDNNPNTGYLFDAIGAEYHIEENMVRKYTGDGDNWNWQDEGMAASAVNGNVVELRFPRSWIGNAASFNLAFYGENIAFAGGSTEDFYPDGWTQEQAPVRFFRYFTQ